MANDLNFDAEKKLLIGDQRRVILCLLEKSQTCSAPDAVIQEALARHYYPLSRIEVREHLRWLEFQGLLKIEQLGERTLMALITQRGIEVVNGLAVVDGVNRPERGALA